MEIRSLTQKEKLLLTIKLLEAFLLEVSKHTEVGKAATRALGHARSALAVGWKEGQG